MGHLFLLMNMEPLQGTDLCIKAPVNFQKSFETEIDREEQDKSSQGSWNRRAVDKFAPHFCFLLEVLCF